MPLELKVKWSFQTSILRIFVGLFCIEASADSLRDNIVFQSSVAHSYDARNVFTNPAALAYESKLNGIGLLTSVSLNLNEVRDNERALGFAIGYFGFGVEHLAETAGQFTRYGFSLAAPLSPYLYLGTRYRFTRSRTGGLDRFNSLDFGIQYRPSNLISFGATAETLNQPNFNGQKRDSLLTLGTIIRPWNKLSLSVDLQSGTDNFARNIIYQGVAGYELIKGLQLRAGYHRTHKIQVGVQFNLGFSSYYVDSRPDTGDGSVMFGAQAAFKPYRSAMVPKTALRVDMNRSLGEQPVAGVFFKKKGLLCYRYSGPYIPQNNEMKSKWSS